MKTGIYLNIIRAGDYKSLDLTELTKAELEKSLKSMGKEVLRTTLLKIVSDMREEKIYGLTR